MAVDLSDGLEWSKVFEQAYFAQTIPDRPNKFKPIPIITVPDFIYSHTIAIAVIVTNSKSSWRFGGKMAQAIKVSDESDIGYFTAYKTYALRINDTTLVQLDKLSEYLKVVLYIPKWFTEVYVGVWSFIGEAPANTVEEQLADIKTQLNRIEGEINVVTGQ